MTLGAPVAAAAGLRLSVQGPLDVGSPITQPEPDFAIVPKTPIDRHPSVLDVQRREIVVHREPRGPAYAQVWRAGVGETLEAVAVALEVAVADLV